MGDVGGRKASVRMCCNGDPKNPAYRNPFSGMWEKIL